ncbi:CRISPR-associated protein Cas4 [Geobacillus sp. NFOSA3]|uniref:CRISPR-associated exonuclease Cas4 n=1 Tax=Parageobacillus galactosidasius TaxID=883812 RepID=A0A226QK76_9BACL|nr:MULTISPECIES: CRISPR-associated protein Cas4 [Bacillaceae]NNU92987.1 CRISPR-associated protein Cas4 [Geobacillus sp. NFOSA3]RDV22831.1 CRISPR-associated protein Cas4 [Parageobacillus toebii]OXB92097.1 CRISPR-associated protein Cas4 [Parageobacillus galactosidasius]PUF89517.1 CRISPR-associated protein Cas4 [Geobacillus sp. LYN3]TXK88483.1 CRISPR-associated protein Cas4 [Geobacillus sp. AYS3]
MVSGVQMHYYKVCKRKLWLFSKGIALEEEHDRVVEGKILHERAYPRLDEREILVDSTFKLDALDGEYIREIKISSKMADADRFQMLYYLYELKKRGIIKKGLISYTKERKTEEVILTEKDEKEIEKAIGEIYRVLQLHSPPPLKKLTYCPKCAYYEFCYALEGDE